ncbi:MAG: hypothetical protein LRY56_09375 [Burkholderiaceae bacterium]|nr:hypothetical protein [Burkholderiaceae bacterium]MCD8516989.1 hypothetical protein [Burkholderiaceae bacterium]MCD8537673.1 hypothetical protein [Burkholderiaceae bacterium]
MSKLKTLLNKSVGLMSRSVMRTGSIILRRRARLEALSAAIEWFVKRNNHQPLQLTHESDYGDLHLMSDGDRIQLTWWIGDKKQPHDSDHTQNASSPSAAKVANAPSVQNTLDTPTADNRSRKYQFAQTATAVNAREAASAYKPMTESGTNCSDCDMRTTPRQTMNQDLPKDETSADSSVGDAVGEFIGEVVDAVIDEMVEQVFDSTEGKQPVARESTAAENIPGSPHPH